MHYTIAGEIAQFAWLEFAPGESVCLSKGALMAYLDGVHWRPRLPGGLSGTVQRALAGEGATLTYAEAQGAGQFALIASNAPGHIAT